MSVRPVRPSVSVGAARISSGHRNCPERMDVAVRSGDFAVGALQSNYSFQRMFK